jgi:hypothetical protein
MVLSELEGVVGLLIVHPLLVVGFKFMHSLVCMLLKLILQRPNLIIFGQELASEEVFFFIKSENFISLPSDFIF